MKRALLVVIIFLTSTFYGASSASAAVADCVTLGTPNVTSTTTSISVQVAMTTNCTTNQLGPDGGIPRYSIVEESTNTSSCTGPETLTPGRTSSIRCSIQIGSTSGSIRAGATTSTLRVTFRFDSSSKLVVFTHSAITKNTDPVPSSNNNFGNNNFLSCNTAPLAPSLNIVYPEGNLGPRFEFGNAPGSDIVSNFFWNYMTFDSKTNTWDPWTKLNVETVDGNGFGLYTFQSLLIPNKTKIAFMVYASNRCGVSPITRENDDASGVPLAKRSLNSIAQNTLFIGLNEIRPVNDIFSSASNSFVYATSNTPATCQIDDYKIIPKSLGECSLTLKADGAYNYSALSNQIFKLNVTKGTQTLVGFNSSPQKIGSKIDVPKNTDQGLLISLELAPNNICENLNGKIVLKASGVCNFKFSNPGDAKFDNYNQIFAITVNKLPQKISIVNLNSGLVLARGKNKLGISSTSNLQVNSKNLTPAVCEVVKGLLNVKNNGICKFELSQNGDGKFAPAPKVTVKLQITLK